MKNIELCQLDDFLSVVNEWHAYWSVRTPNHDSGPCIKAPLAPFLEMSLSLGILLATSNMDSLILSVISISDGSQ